MLVAASNIISRFMVHLSCKGALGGAAVALAGSGDLPPCMHPSKEHKLAAHNAIPATRPLRQVKFPPEVT
jgi:hypothetical protein